MSWAKIYATYHRFTGSWAFLGHRIAGLALVGYVFMHIWSLKGLQKALPPGADPASHPWNEFVGAYTRGIFPLLEWLLFAAVLFHALNGVRVAIVDLGNGSKYHKPLFWVLTIIGAVLFLGMGATMFSHTLIALFG